MLYGKSHALATGTANQVTVSAGQVVSLPSDVIIDSPGLATTTTRGLGLRNDTDSTSGVPVQYSPAFDLHGHGWSTAVGGSDRDVRFRTEVQPVSGSTVIGYHVLKSSIDTGTPSWTNHSLLVSSKPLIDQSVSGAAANNYMTLDTVDTVSSAGFGASAGFTWLRFLSNGTLRARFDWHAGNSFRMYIPGRGDVEAGTQIFFTAPNGFFMQSNTSINRTADATGTSTQRPSFILDLQSSVWTGSAAAHRFAQLRAVPSTTVNLDHSLITYLGGNDANSVGTEVMRVFWDDSESRAKVGIGTNAPTAHLHLKAGTTAAEAAPLKFTSGSLQTTAEAGAMEFLTDKLYFTITSSAVRNEVVLDHPTTGSSITSGIVHGEDSAGGAATNLVVRGGDSTSKAGNGGTLVLSGGSSSGGTSGSTSITKVDGTTKLVEVNETGLGFYSATPVAQQTGVAVTAAGIHAALVNLGLITA